MKPIEADEILAYPDYQRVRERLRPLFIGEKNRRRITVANHLTLLFENSRTIWYQIEEMLLTERITEPAAIQHEIETYNELMPGGGELSATLMIEFLEEPAQRTERLRELLGIDRHLWIAIDARRIPARFDIRQMTTDRVSAVQFVRFPLGIGHDRFLEQANKGQVAIEVDHPKLAGRYTVEAELAATLAEDLVS
ncbi:MAG TPA: DUF3501 family protein [Candidatus Binataceae bacterium]|nr:DUF3501 family protein [Candidatus Binataceae bacterium]